MTSSDFDPIAGDIILARVDHLDDARGLCYLEAASLGSFVVELVGLEAATIAALAAARCVCAQVLDRRDSHGIPYASVLLEFCGRSSALIIDGCSLIDSSSASAPDIVVSERLQPTKRAELAVKLRETLDDESTGLALMLDAIGCGATIVVRTCAAELAWEAVVSDLLTRATQAATLAALANISEIGASLMTEARLHPESATRACCVGDVSCRLGHPIRIGLSSGVDICFEKTSTMTTVGVVGPVRDVDPALIDRELACVVAEALVEYDMHGVVAVRFVPGLTLDTFNDLIDVMQEIIADPHARFSGDAALFCALIER